MRIGVAERMEVVIDFSQFAGKSIYLENRLNQLNGQGPSHFVNGGSDGVQLPEILPAGQGNQLLRFDVSSTASRTIVRSAEPDVLQPAADR